MTDESFRSIPPPIKEMTAFRLPPMKMRMLDSGIRLNIYDGCREPLCNLTLVTPGGDAEYGSMAVSALSSILRREGTRSFLGKEINSGLDFNGAILSLASSSHHQTQSLRSLNANLADTLPLFRSMALEPAMDETALNVRREALARNIEVAMTDVDFLAKCASDRLAMGSSHPSSHIDTPKEIRSITRRHLLEKFSRFCDPSQWQLFLSGNITPRIEDMVAEAFNDISTGCTFPGLNINPYNPAEALAKVKTERPDALQSSVMITLPAIPRSHPDYIPLHIAVSALGGYFGSRLMLNIRERLGLTYGISASLLGTLDGAFIQIQADTDPSHVSELIEQVAAELQRMHFDPPAGEELCRLRQSLLSGQAAILDSPISISDYYVTALTTGIPAGYFEAKLEAIAALRPEHIAAVSRRYLQPSLMRTAIAGA